MLKAAVISKEVVERALTDVSEGRVSDVVSEGYGLDQILVQAKAAGYGASQCGNLDGVGQSRSIRVRPPGGEDLGFAFELAERDGVYYSVAVALIGGAKGVGVLRIVTAGRLAGPHRVGREVLLG